MSDIPSTAGLKVMTTTPTDRPTPRDKPGPEPGFLCLVRHRPPGIGSFLAFAMRVHSLACPDCFAALPWGVMLWRCRVGG